MTSTDATAARQQATDEASRETPTVDVGVVAAHSPASDAERLESFAGQAAGDAADELRRATDVPWRFHEEEPLPLPDGEPRRPSAFLDEAMLRMAEGPYDVVVVVTDAPLRARASDLVPGLASPIGRVAVLSTRRLLMTSRGRPVRTLGSPTARWNGATLLLHLLGHVLGARHADDPDSAMAPFRFEEDRRSTPAFDADVGRYLRRIVGDIPEPNATPRDRLGLLAFHVRSAVRNPREVLAPLVRNRAPLLPLSLPKLATAAVAPTLVLVFSAETWDVGVHLTDAAAALFAVASVVAAAVYLTAAQDMFFPREPGRVVTEHVALVNVAAFLTMLAATAGLFVMVGLLMLTIQLFVFPPDLVTNWPTLENPVVTDLDLVRTAAFVSTVGVLTGALAGGIENRAAVRHLALFLERP